MCNKWRIDIVFFVKFSFLHVLPSVYKFVRHDICIICDVDEQRLHIPDKERAVASYVPSGRLTNVRRGKIEYLSMKNVILIRMLQTHKFSMRYVQRRRSLWCGHIGRSGACWVESPGYLILIKTDQLDYSLVETQNQFIYCSHLAIVMKAMAKCSSSIRI